MRLRDLGGFDGDGGLFLFEIFFCRIYGRELLDIRRKNLSFFNLL